MSSEGGPSAVTVLCEGRARRAQGGARLARRVSQRTPSSRARPQRILSDQPGDEVREEEPSCDSSLEHPETQQANATEERKTRRLKAAAQRALGEPCASVDRIHGPQEVTLEELGGASVPAALPQRPFLGDSGGRGAFPGSRGWASARRSPACQG